MIEAQPNFLINTILDKTKANITIEDFGIGLTKNKLVNNLWMIDKPGTKTFTVDVSASCSSSSDALDKIKYD